jgi:hypothetical protein
MQNSTYNPTRTIDFEKEKLTFDAQGVSATITAGNSQNLVYALTDDCLITGVELIVNNGSYGDTINFQVIDSSGAFTGTPGTVLNQFASNWNVTPISDTQFDIVYPAKILTGMGLQVVYKSTGTSNVFLAINYKLHKCMV